MTTENFNITVREDGARVVARNIREIGESSKEATSGVSMLKQALGGIAVALGLNEVRKITSVMTDLRSRIDLVSGSAANTAAIMDRLGVIAKRNYADFESTAESYLRGATALQQLGYSTNDTLNYTEALSNALTVSGAKGERAETVINALSKAMMKGTLDGINWLTVLQQGGRVVEAIATGTGKSLRELDQAARAGQLSTSTVFDALTSQLKKLQEEADSMPATIDDAFRNLRTSIMTYIHDVDRAIGFTTMIVSAIDYVSEHIDIFIKSFLTLGAAITLGPMLATLVSALRTLAVVLLNPLSAITALATGLVLFRDEIRLGVDDTTSLGDMFRALGEQASDLRAVLGEADGLFDQLGMAATDTMDRISNAVTGATGDWRSSFSTFFADTGSGWAGFITLVARIFDTLAAVIRGFIMYIGRALGGIPGIFGNVFKEAYNSVVEQLENILNSVVSGINKIRGAIGQDLIETVKFEKAQVDENYFKQYRDSLNNAMADSFDIQDSYVEKWVRSTIAQAQKIGADRVRKAAGGVANLDTRGAKPGALTDSKKAAKEAEKLENQLRRLLNQIDPTSGALLELARAEEILNKALVDGHPLAERKAQYLELLHRHYADIIDPLGALNRELEREIMLLGLSADARQIEEQVYRTQQDLQKRGIILTEREIEAKREEYAILQQVGKVSAARDQLLADTIGRQETYINQLQAINDLLADQDSGFTPGMAAQVLVREDPDLFAGTRKAIAALMQDYKDNFDKIQALRAADLVDNDTYNLMVAQQTKNMSQAVIQAHLDMSQALVDLDMGTWADQMLLALDRVRDGFVSLQASTTEAMGSMFATLSDGFADSIGRAIVYAEDLGSALKDVARQAISQLISALVKMAIQWAVNAAIGQSIAAASQAASVGMAAATGSAMAAAYAPAAAMASLASFGANAAPAMAGITATQSLATAFAMMGFKTGGYTGDLGINDIAGVVHGKEYVVNAKATAKNRPVLEAINNGAQISNATPQISVSIENYGTSKAFEVQQISKEEIRIIARDEAQQTLSRDGDKMVANNLANASSRTSRTLGTVTTATRNFK